MAETAKSTQSRRHDYRFLSNVRDALLSDRNDSHEIKARRMGFSRSSMAVFGAVLIAPASARFRLWLAPEGFTVEPEQTLEFSDTERWRIVGVVERIVDGELVGHDVMVASYGG